MQNTNQSTFKSQLRYRLTLIIIVIQIYNLSAQNLIQNSGFDIQFKGNEDELYTTKYWYLNNVNALYFKPCETNCGYIHPARFGKYSTMKKPRSKNVFLGLFAIKNDNQRGFISSRLISALDSNQVYYFEMYVQLGFFSTYATDKLNVYFTKDSVGLWEKQKISTKIISEIGGKIGVLTLQKSDKSMIIEREWTLISGFYTAKGGEQFVTIGNLDLNDKTPKTKIMKSETTDTMAFYFMDDVSLIKYDGGFESAKTGKPMVLNNILFETDKAELLPESFVVLNTLLIHLNNYPKTKIEISGHTDNTGNEEHNQTLSSNRAKSVVDYLCSKGINKDRLTFKGFGSSKPIADNITEQGKEKNRRVEIMVLAK